MTDEELKALINEVAVKVVETGQSQVELSIGSIRLTGADLDLLQLCPLISLLGVGAAFLVKQKFPTKPHLWALGTLRGGILGIVAGLLVAVFFLGMATNTTWSTPRILLLSFFMGANAKIVWESALSLSKSFIAEGHKLAAGRAARDEG